MPSPPDHTLRASPAAPRSLPRVGTLRITPGPRAPDHAHLLEKCHPRPVLLALVSDCHRGPRLDSEPECQRTTEGREPAQAPTRPAPAAGSRGRSAAPSAGGGGCCGRRPWARPRSRPGKAAGTRAGQSARSAAGSLACAAPAPTCRQGAVSPRGLR